MKETKINGISILAKDNVLAPAEAEAVARNCKGLYSQAAADEVRSFHRGVPGYDETKLVSLSSAAAKHGVRGIYVKDESTRFGLKAFKGLGGSYAVFRTLCERFGLDPSKTSFEDLTGDEMKEKISELTFVTATDGNHGKGVAWASKLFGSRAYVYMPIGTVEARRKAIEDAGAALVEITEFNYDGAVELANSKAEENGWILVQDTAWDGYEDIPTFIAQGYLTLACEACDRLEEMTGGDRPTHVFLQAGVGSMAGAVAANLTDRYKDAPPAIGIVEPDTVACIYESAKAGDGKAHSIGGNPVTIMAGLNCGTPCSIVWPVLRDAASFYVACPDSVTEYGMRSYAHPEEGDPKVVSGESGAVTYGLTLRILEDEKLRSLFGMDENSVILVISTEGDTDPENYRKITEG